MNSSWSGFLAICLTVPSLTVNAADPPRAEPFLIAGRLSDGARDLKTHLEAQPGDDQTRFGLGTLQFLQAIEHFGQSLYRYGAGTSRTPLGIRVPLLQMPVPENPDPEPISYADFRRMLQTLIDDLAKAEQTLSAIKDRDVTLPLRFAQIRLDLTGDDRATDEETLWRIYAAVSRNARADQQFTQAEAEAFTINFDYGDVHWLTGYCHLLSALGEMALTYDGEAFFNAIASHAFARPAHPLLKEELMIRPDNRWTEDIADAIAAIHLLRLPVKEPQRGPEALKHLEAVIRHSRLSWLAIQEEADDDREWVPNPRQTGVIPGVRVTQELIAGWHTFLDEAEQLLQGRKLAPHWRVKGEYGINLKRVFTEPRELDLVLWAHGAGVTPFVERGLCTRQETWNRLMQTFQGQFIGFAVWFN